jgi:hypothetical protein
LAIAFIMYRETGIFALSWREHFSEAELAVTIIFSFVGATGASGLVPQKAPHRRTTTMVFLAAFCTAKGDGAIQTNCRPGHPVWIISPE